jgi:hypothetical protein
MSEQSNDGYNPFDPTTMFKQMRDTSLHAWAKAMVDLVNTDAYAQANGAMLDAWLHSSGPFRKVIESTMRQTLTQLSLPTRDDVTRLAERLTNIELRLDDLDAKLDESLRLASRASSGGKTKPDERNKK